MKMRTIAAVLVLLTFGIALTHGTAANENRNSTGAVLSNTNHFSYQGILFSSPEGRFSIRLPLDFPTFKESKETQTTSVGPVETHFFSSQTARGASVLAYTDFPPTTFVSRTPEKILEDGRDGALKSGSAVLEKEERTMRQGHPTLVFYATSTSGGRPIYIRFDLVLAQPRTYQIGFLTYERAILNGPDAQAYFKSFRIEEAAGPAPH
jgi:hypothetical protein